MIFVKQRENLEQLENLTIAEARYWDTRPFIHYELYMRFVRFPSTEEVVEHTLQIEQQRLEGDGKATRGRKHKSEENKRRGYVSRGTWKESLEVKEEKYSLNVSSQSLSRCRLRCRLRCRRRRRRIEALVSRNSASTTRTPGKGGPHFTSR